MHKATIVYPHQLFKTSPALAAAKAGDWPVYVVEEPLILTHNPTHRQKLMFHKLSLDAYQRELETSGYTVVRLENLQHTDTQAVFDRLKKDGISEMHIVDTTDDYLERAIAASGLKRVWYESPLFILKKEEAVERYKKSKRFMARFYTQLRRERNILIDKNGEPTGGQWSFDADNRKKLPKDTELPKDIEFFENTETKAATTWATSLEVEQYGEAGCWVAYTRAGAEKFLQEFLRARFYHFGPYEDTMTTRGVRLFHSALSPLINVGLLTPQAVLDEAITYAEENNVPINSLEGFVRQILGWREFIRASYECEGRTMRTQNFWHNYRALPKNFWTGRTGINPLDQVIHTAQQYGYTHHIERLMVMGNFMLLCEIHPHHVYHWFMGMYLDAYDWVMVPNVYGMSQFSDGGSFATKPYISGSNYIKKMSDYSGGDWEEIWTALYWRFIATHSDVFEHNHRLSMMPRLYQKMDQAKQQRYQDIAQTFLHQFDTN